MSEYWNKYIRQILTNRDMTSLTIFTWHQYKEKIYRVYTIRRPKYLIEKSLKLVLAYTNYKCVTLNS